jgi:hypothetical protein
MHIMSTCFARYDLLNYIHVNSAHVSKAQGLLLILEFIISDFKSRKTSLGEFMFMTNYSLVSSQTASSEGMARDQ